MVKKITRCAIIVAIDIVCSYVLKFFPNVKPDTTMIIILAVYYTLGEAILVSIVTVLLRGFLFGIGTFLPFQLLAWVLIACIARLLRNELKNSKFLFILYAAISGYVFGFIVSLDTLFLYGFKFFIVYYTNGLLFDTFHLVGNVIFSSILLNTVLTAKNASE